MIRRRGGKSILLRVIIVTGQCTSTVKQSVSSTSSDIAHPFLSTGKFILSNCRLITDWFTSTVQNIPPSISDNNFSISEAEMLEERAEMSACLERLKHDIKQVRVL